MNFLNLKMQLAKVQFAILLLGFILQRSPAVQIVSLFEKALRLPAAQVVKSATWLATGMGLFHATAGATGLITQVNGGSQSNKTSFTFEVGEQVSLSLVLDGIPGISYWEIDARSDLVDGLDFFNIQGDQVPLLGPEPRGVNQYYRVNTSAVIMSGVPTTPSVIAVDDPAKDKNVLSVKAYTAAGVSEGAFYQINIEVPPSLPEILRPPGSTRVPVGGRAQFFFESSGVVDSVQWLKDNVELAGETDMTLIIQNVSAADEGVYSVRVGNSAGTATSGGGVLTIDDASADLVNLATRGLVGAGGDIMIGGLTVLGGSTKTVLVRGLGPQLAAEGVPGALADPELRVFQTLFDETPIRSQMLVTNDNWEEDSNAVELEAALISLNKPLAAGSKDAALLLTLNEGVYTFQLSGVGDTEGVGLIELFVVE